MQTTSSRPTGMVGFTIVWLGQIVSVLATNMTQFALTIFVYQETNSATALGLVQVFFITPFLIMSPFAGVMVDRYDRKLMMMVSDIGSGIATITILVLQAMGILEVWHLYVTAAITGTFQAFQWPAYSAAISSMVPKEQLGRANGMMSLVEAGPGVIAPILAGALMGFIGLTGVMLIDVVTFILAVLALLVVAIPAPKRTEEGRKSQGNILKEASYGFKYIFDRPSLLGLQLVFLFGNLMAGFGQTVMAPMILARTGNSEVTLGSVLSIGAVGGILGGVLMSAWGGPKRRVHGVLFGHVLLGIFAQVLLGINFGFVGWAAGVFITGLLIPIVNGSNQAIWQSKVAPDIQGRVFASRRLIAWITQPLSPLIAGPLVDFFLEPAMKGNGALPNTFGWLVGTGAGAGMGLLLVLSGLAVSVVGAVAYLFRPVRDAEDVLPDHDALPEASS